MVKCGLSTFEAIDTIANLLYIPSEIISYGGLKDEEAITDQTICLPGLLDPKEIESINKSIQGVPEKFIRLYYIGKGQYPLKIGELQGNSFKIVIRGLKKQNISQLRDIKKINFLFANYYDAQRFGIPNAPQLTHLIGRSLLDADYEEAYKLMVLSKTTLSDMQVQKSHYRQFFESLDIRKQLFYRNAYSSYQWNEEIKTKIKGITNGDFSEYNEGDINFFFPNKSSVLLQLLEINNLNYLKYRVNEGIIKATTSIRPIVIQCVIEVNEIEIDDIFDCRWKCGVSFFLPSGCYATMAIKQLFHYIMRE